MARIRTIKPSLWDSEKLGKLSLLARLTFVGLISFADDEGRGRGELRWLIGHIHPYAPDVSEQGLRAALKELEKWELAAFYEILDAKYYALPGWNHQKIDRPTASELPPVPKDHPIRRLFDEHSSLDSIVRDSMVLDRKGRDIDARHFAPPTLDEVRDYCRERNNSVNPGHWLDFYSAKGWMVGRNKMKDWKAAVRTWEHNGKENGTKRNAGYAAPIPGKYGD